MRRARRLSTGVDLNEQRLQETIPDSSNGVATDTESGQPPPKRIRGPTACDKCRERKTKCDNARPSCRYCSKHQIQCVYSDDGLAAPWDDVGDRVLQAISELTDLVKQQQGKPPPHRGSITSGMGRPSFVPTALHTLSPRTTHASAAVPNTTQADAISTIDLPDNASHKAQGTNSVLEWPILKAFATDDCLFSGEISSSLTKESIPDTNCNRLTYLARRYVDGVHIKNPILDLTELNRCIAQVAENGLDWSTNTCLVTLVCAIGAISQRYGDEHTSTPGRPTPGGATPTVDSDQYQQLSMQFWNIAAKRLGLAIGDNDIQAVQCLCLAGIYQMYRIQPLQAWKYFNLAGAAWTAIMLTRGKDDEHIVPNGNSKSFTRMQSLYFTIWKSECELKVEIDVPGPLLGTVDFPHAFPSPPIPDPSSPADEIEEGERIWYYYLAEIAARHLINRIVGAVSSTVWPPTTEQIEVMVRWAEILESQVFEWQRSLPNMLSFDPPIGFTSVPHPDDLTNILCHRYLTCRQLIARPFVRICLEAPSQITQRQRSRIEYFASEEIRFCMLRLTQTAVHLHQGTWFGFRSVTTAILILSAVHIAKTSSLSRAAQRIALPTEWKISALAAVECMSSYSTVKEGGTSNLYGLLQRVLSAVDSP